MILNEKERSVIEDLQTQEKSCVEKYARYAGQAKDPELQNLFGRLQKEEQEHYDSLGQVLSGTVPSCNCNDNAGREYQLLLLLGGTLAAELIRNAGSDLSLERLWRTLLVALLLFYSFLCMRTAICGKGFEERREAEPKNGVVAKYAARAGLHMLLIGMAAWYISHGSLWQIVSIWIPAFLAAVGGLAYGYWYGTKWRRQISFAGGLLLLLTGGLFAAL